MILLVDGSWLAHMLWWSSPADTPARFRETVFRIASGIIDDPVEGWDVRPYQVTTVAWDAPGGSWRSEILPSYKGHRKAKPEALTHALAQCRRLPGMSHVEVEGFEADDILATLALAHVRELSDPTYILTADKDLAQIVCAGANGVSLVNARGDVTDCAEVEAKFGVPPWRMRHWLSWAGDSSDGLPGVAGVGPKRAIPHALAGEIGDPLTWDLVELATVPADLLAKAPERARIKAQEADYAGFHYEQADESPPPE